MGPRNNLRNITHVCFLYIMLNPHQYKQKHHIIAEGIGSTNMCLCLFVSTRHELSKIDQLFNWFVHTYQPSGSCRINAVHIFSV